MPAGEHKKKTHTSARVPPALPHRQPAPSTRRPWRAPLPLCPHVVRGRAARGRGAARHGRPAKWGGGEGGLGTITRGVALAACQGGFAPLNPPPSRGAPAAGLFNGRGARGAGRGTARTRQHTRTQARYDRPRPHTRASLARAPHGDLSPTATQGARHTRPHACLGGWRHGGRLARTSSRRRAARHHSENTGVPRTPLRARPARAPAATPEQTAARAHAGSHPAAGRAACARRGGRRGARGGAT